MNKKGALLDVLYFIIILIVFVALLIGTLFLGYKFEGYNNSSIAHNNCERFENEYNLLVKVKDTGFKQYRFQCYIIMEDGTEILEKDFNIATIKTPRYKKDAMGRTGEK